MTDPFPKFGEAILEYKRDTLKSQIKGLKPTSKRWKALSENHL